MAWWGLLIEVFAVWLLWAIAAATGHEVSAARRGILEGQRGGVSLAPILPVFPLAFWGAALLADLAVGPWGTVVVGGFHAALGVVFVGSVARDWWRLRRLTRPAEPVAAPDRRGMDGF
jgi:hypothetical protein